MRSAQRRESQSNGLRQQFLHYFVFFAFGLSGAAALVYEVVWTRKLSAIMGSSTYALSTMLAAFMTGLALGAAIGALLVPRLRRPLRTFAICEIAIGLTALATVPLIKASAPLFLRVYFFFHQHGSFQAFSIAQFVIVFLIILVPTTLMGMTFPLVVKYFAESEGEIAARTGFLYAFNTLGAVAGSIGAGFLLIPLLGSGDATLVAALLNLGGGLVILILSASGKRPFALIPVVLVGAAVLRLSDPTFVPLVSHYGAHRFGSYELIARILGLIREVGPERVLVFEHEGLESDVYLMRDPAAGSERMVLSNNGKLEGGADSAGFPLLAYLPYFSRDPGEANPKVLNIGLGSGVTLSHLAELPASRIESVEISRGILEANRRFLSPELFSDPRIWHIVADGRNYLRVGHERRWDVIVVSPSWAVELASAALLTDEFFSLASRRLEVGGTIAIWLDLFYTPDEDLDIILRTFRRSFPHATAWLVENQNMIVVGSLTHFAAPPQEVLRRVIAHAPTLEGELRVALTDYGFDRLEDGPINTDDHPIIEFRNARRLIMGSVFPSL